MLTFFCELEAHRLATLIDSDVLETLARARAAVALALPDLSHERASFLRALQQYNIPFTAWMLLDERDGYWLTVDNVERAQARYREIHAWIRQHDLAPRSIGLDVETPLSDSRALFDEGRRALWRLLAKRRSRDALHSARRGYQELLERIRLDGFAVESYQFPLVVDERRARSTILQRALGFVDIKTDREVLMLYGTLLPRPWSRWLIDVYGPEADAIAVGITGGGVDFVLKGTGGRLLSLEDLILDLRRAARYTPQLYVFSLEGCVERGLLDPLCEANIDVRIPPASFYVGGHIARAALRTLLRSEPVHDLLVSFLPHKSKGNGRKGRQHDTIAPMRTKR